MGPDDRPDDRQGGSLTKSLYVVTPAFGGQVYVKYHQSMMGLQSMARERGVPLSYHHVVNNSLIPVARNTAADEFLKTEHTHLMFIDADIEFQPADVFKMLDLDLLLVGGGYPFKKLDLDSVIDTYRRTGMRELAKASAYSQVGNVEDMSQVVALPGKSCIQLRHIPTGFMLIAREVFERISARATGSECCGTWYDRRMNATRTFKFAFDYFPVGCDTNQPVEDRIYNPEDFGFCELARAAGIQPHLYLPAQLHHWGLHKFEGFPWQAVMPEQK